jgi:hypothetical protein
LGSYNTKLDSFYSIRAPVQVPFSASASNSIMSDFPFSDGRASLDFHWLRHIFVRAVHRVPCPAAIRNLPVSIIRYHRPRQQGYLAVAFFLPYLFSRVLWSCHLHMLEREGPATYYLINVYNLSGGEVFGGAVCCIKQAGFWGLVPDDACLYASLAGWSGAGGLQCDTMANRGLISRP